MRKFNFLDPWHLFVCFALMIMCGMFPAEVLASPFQGTLDNAVQILTGKTGKAIATLAVIFAGIGYLMGKLSAPMAMIMTGGIAAVFGAVNIVEILSPDPCSVSSGANPIASVFCALIEEVQGPTGKSLATLAVIMVGIGALMGKVSWGMCLITTIGIGSIFGAQNMLMLIAPQFALVQCGIGSISSGGGSGIEGVLCEVVGLLLGGGGRAIATVAVITVGIGALMGKVSWGLAMIVLTGIILVFGSASIVEMLTGQTPSCGVTSVAPSC